MTNKLDIGGKITSIEALAPFGKKRVSDRARFTHAT
jgi:hypothetical protein